MAEATSENKVLVLMSEIKFDLTLKKKSNFLFLLRFKLLPTLRLLRHKTNFFPSHFASIWSCLGAMILGINAVLYLENEAK